MTGAAEIMLPGAALAKFALGYLAVPGRAAFCCCITGRFASAPARRWAGSRG
jgi:hypothetical protein